MADRRERERPAGVRIWTSFCRDLLQCPQRRSRSSIFHFFLEVERFDWIYAFFLCNGRVKIDLHSACARYMRIGLPHIVMMKYYQISFSWFCDALMLINILYNIIYLHIGLPHIVMLKYSQIFFSWFSDALMLINMTLQHRSETLNCPTQDINMFPCQRLKGFNFANVQIRNKSQNLILNMKAKFWAKREWKQRHFVSLELFGWVKVHCC